MTTVTVVLKHRSSVPGARWCEPVDWVPENQIEGAEYVDGGWWDETSEVAGLVAFVQGDEGDVVEVDLDAVKLASGNKVIDNVEYPDVTALESLCGRLEGEASDCGGLSHHAAQESWGISVEVDGEGCSLVDCDGETWASGSSKEILAKESSLIRKIHQYAALNE